jgi:Protein of unknown function (DUF3237)
MEPVQSARLVTEYLMTVCAPLEPPQQIDETLLIVCVGQGGWAKGPKINATVIQPAADWIQAMPNGSRRIDVRLTLKTDDGALIYASYNGVIRHTEASRDRLAKGEIVTSDDSYFIIAPTFRTSHAKYAWLNSTQAIGKLLERKPGEGGYIKYDIFAVK